MKDVSEKIDRISTRLESVRSIIELIAEGVVDESYSAALWGCVDLLNAHVEKLNLLAQECHENRTLG